MDVGGNCQIVYKDCVDGDNYHHKESLESEGKQGFEVVCSNMSPFPVAHAGYLKPGDHAGTFKR